METLITQRQLKYLNILMDRDFGCNRKLILKNVYGVDSSKLLTKDQASDIIDKLAPDNRCEKTITNWGYMILEAMGQTKLF